MKINSLFKKYILLVLLIPMVFTSCESFIDGENIDPNNASDGPIEAITRGAQVGLILSIEGEDTRVGSMWSQQFTGNDRQYSSTEVYNVVASEWDWAAQYYTTIQQANIAIAKAQELGNEQHEGMLLVMKAMTYGYVTSLWGDIPFTESNQYPAITDPVFDDQLTVVYPGIQAMLDEAITKLSGSGSILTGAEVISLGGNSTNWIAAAYTLKARYYLHVGDYANAITAANNGISATANDMNAIHAGGVYNGDMNLWYSFIEFDRNGYLDASNSTLAALLRTDSLKTNGEAKTNEAARLVYYINTIYETDGDGNFVLDDDNNLINESVINTASEIDTTGFWKGDKPTFPAFFQADSPYPMLTYRENQLILAEAAFRTGDRATAITALNNVRADLDSDFKSIYLNFTFLLGVTNPATETFYEAYVDADLPGDALIEEIMEERYMTLVAQIEAYNDCKRNVSGKVALTPRGGAASIPLRYFYPQDEINTNSNTPVQVAADLFEPTKANGGTK